MKKEHIKQVKRMANDRKALRKGESQRPNGSYDYQ